MSPDSFLISYIRCYFVDIRVSILNIQYQKAELYMASHGCDRFSLVRFIQIVPFINISITLVPPNLSTYITLVVIILIPYYNFPRMRHPLCALSLSNHADIACECRWLFVALSITGNLRPSVWNYLSCIKFNYHFLINVYT